MLRGYEAYQNRVNRGYEAYQNRVNRGYEAYQNRVNSRTLWCDYFLGVYMQNWLIVDEKYLDSLRVNIEKRIPFSDYGSDKFKPFFGVLFEKDDLLYITQVSHYSNLKHDRMRNALDFKKIYIPSKIAGKPDVPACVVNLNYMFPIPKSLVSNLEYRDIHKHRTFLSELEKSKYIDLLRDELKAINTMNLEMVAKKIYKLKQEVPQDKISQRCFDFLKLEAFALEYVGKN